MLGANWSEVLKSDLDKLSQLTSLHPKSEITRLKEGERRIVTILFLDIQGFTAMSEKLDPEDVQLIIDNCFKILTNEVEKYHGYIDKYEGDRMMALFGSRHASEQDCERALKAGLGMKEKFLEVNKILAQRNIKIGVRIGVNTGLVVTGHIGKGRDQDFTVMGDAVNLASRLETNAPPGEILISEEVKRTVGEIFICESLGKIEVKGKSEPILVFCVKGLNPARPERWERSPFTKRSRYVPRESEQKHIYSSFHHVKSNGGSTAIAICAPAGVGKSRLVYEFFKEVREREERPPLIFRGAAVASHTVPYGLWGDFLGRVMSDSEISKVFVVSDPDQASQAERLKPVVNYLSGRSEADQRMRSLEPQALRLEIHLSIRFVIEQLAKLAAERKSSPVILYLEDLQWADFASLEALEFLGSNFQIREPILFLWTYRSEFQLKEELRKSFRTLELPLNPLSDKECGAILDDVLEGLELSQRDRKMLVTRSGGNPFFMEELIQSLIDDNTIFREGDKWILSRPIEESFLPDTVQRILVARIDRLEKDHKELLMAASVVGEVVPLTVMEAIAQRMGISSDFLTQWLRIVEDLGFIYRRREDGLLGPQIAFRHALTRDVVYSMILNHNKKILHELVAKAYEKTYGERSLDHASLLFHHFSGAGLVQETLKYGLVAIDQMIRQYATREGLRAIATLRAMLEGGVQAIDAFETEIQLLEAEIKLYDFLGQRNDQLRSIEILEKLNATRHQPSLEALAAQARATYYTGIGEFRKTRECATEGLRKIENEPGLERPRMDLLRALGIACYSIGDYAAALKYYEKGIKISEYLGDVSSKGALLNTIGLVYFNTGKLKEALAHYEEAFALMRKIGDRKGEANALGNQGLVCWALGEYSKALEQLQESHKIFGEIGFRKGQAVTLGNMGVIYQKLGLYDQALRSFEKALSLRQSIRDRAGEGFDLVNIGVVYTRLSNYTKALEYLFEGRKVAREVGSNYLLCEALNSLSLVHRKLGATDPECLNKAKENAQEALSLARDHKLGQGETKALSNLASASWLFGDLERAISLSSEALKLIQSDPAGIEGSEEEIYINHYHLLFKSGKREEALQILGSVVSLIQSRAQRIKEDQYRKSFLEEVAQNRFALEEWRKQTE